LTDPEGERMRGMHPHWHAAIFAREKYWRNECLASGSNRKRFFSSKCIKSIWPAGFTRSRRGGGAYSAHQTHSWQEREVGEMTRGHRGGIIPLPLLPGFATAFWFVEAVF